MHYAKFILIGTLTIVLSAIGSVNAYKYLTTTTIEDVSRKVEAFEKAKSDMVQAKLEYCYDNRLDSKKCEEVIVGTGTINAKATTGSVIPVAKRPENKIVSVECEWGEIEKVEGIEFHFTATDEETTLQAIKNAHVNKGSEHIGYHYVIKPDGEITNTRATKCVAAADKWHKNNYRFIQVAFVGDDKPTDRQYDSILKLTILLQKKYNLPIDAVSAHNEWGPKNKKESLDYWYGSKEDFIKLIRSKYQISIYGKQSEELTYMWQAWGDIDFIGTIFQESRMKNTSVGDGGNSIGYCQIHKELQPGWHSYYKSLETMQERLNYCHELYTYAKGLKGSVGSRFHGFDAREKHIENISIQ